ncbi:MAG: sugar phosphate nucleotidyltransferase [Pseudomonadota bacterium]|nr:sugar phosphate nucleotidyltransferase [Pseudomonadota bacterium]
MTTINDIEFVIPCGGKSTRNYPHSKGIAHKALLPFGDTRLIDFVLKDIIHIGGRHITLVCSSQAVIDVFKDALAPDPKMEEKLRNAGRIGIADALHSTFLPPDVDLKYTIQDKPIGTAHVLGLAHRLSPNRHALMSFPDDIMVSHNADNSHFKRMIDTFILNPKQILLTGIEKEDVSNNSIIHNGRLIEKPKIFYNHIAGFSPYIFPKEMLDFVTHQVDIYEQTGKLPENLPMTEWVYTDAINQFLDAHPNEGWDLKMFMKAPEDLLFDTGNLPMYEEAQLYALLRLSQFKDKLKNMVWDLINE